MFEKQKNGRKTKKWSKNKKTAEKQKKFSL